MNLQNTVMFLIVKVVELNMVYKIVDAKHSKVRYGRKVRSLPLNTDKLVEEILVANKLVNLIKNNSFEYKCMNIYIINYWVCD